MTGFERFHRPHQPFQPRLRRRQILPAKLQFGPIMRLKAQHPEGERVEAPVDQCLQSQEFAGRLAHFPAAPLDIFGDEEIIMHPDIGTSARTMLMRLILRDFIGVVDFAMVNAAGVNIERKAEQRA